MMGAAITTNFEATQTFLRTLDPNGVFSFATFDDQSERKSPALATRRHGALVDHLPELIALNEAGAGVFVSVNALDGIGYGNKNVLRIRSVFVDLDGADLAPVTSWTLKPHLVVETSPGRWHAHWLIDGLEPDEFRRYQKALAARFNGDPAVCDEARVMRLPGFYHNKSEPTEVRLIESRADLPRYTPAQLDAALHLGHGIDTAIENRTQNCMAEIMEGTRNAGLASIAGRMRRAGYSGDEISARLRAINDEHCVPPLPRSEVELIGESISSYHPAASLPVSLETTDTGNARRFVAQHSKDVRHVPETGKWLLWKGSHWEEDRSGTVIERAKETAESIFRSASAHPSESARTALAKHAAASLNRSRLLAMIALAQSDQQVLVHLNELNANDFVLGVQNGSVDLRTGSFRPAAREDFITQRSAATFDPEARCPTFEKFLDRITGSDAALKDYIQRLVGYSLTGCTSEHCFAFLYGNGANGKSTLLDVVQMLLGDYASHTQPETLMAKRAGSGASNDLARLVGKRLVVSNEVREGAHLEENLIKQLVGGDTVTARFLYQEHFEFRPKFKLMIAGNHRPVIKGDDDGIWRRVHLVPFAHTIPEKERDKELGEKLRQELSGILNWAIQGCLAWQRDGLAPPAIVSDATRRYRSDMDLLQAWIDEQCEVAPGHRSPSKQLYENYVKWCEDTGLKPMTQVSFVRKLEDRGFSRRHTRSGNVAEGIALKRSPLASVA